MYTLQNLTRTLKRTRIKRGKRDLRWEAVRRIVCKREAETCQKCGRHTPLNEGDGAHIKKRSTHPELKYDPENVRWNCSGMFGCHAKQHDQEEHGLCPRRPR